MRGTPPRVTSHMSPDGFPLALPMSEPTFMACGILSDLRASVASVGDFSAYGFFAYSFRDRQGMTLTTWAYHILGTLSALCM